MQVPTTVSGKPEVSKKQSGSPHNPSLWQQIVANRWSYIYLAPMVILVLTFTIYPMIASLGYTLYQWNGIGDPSMFVGLDNFRRVMVDQRFWAAFGHTFMYTAVQVPVQLVLALALALVLNNPKLRFSTFYRSIYFIPAVTSPAIIGVVMNLMINTFGDTIDSFLQALHITNEHIVWLADPRVVMWVIIVIGIWNTLGYNMVYFLAGLQTIPTELYEAAQIDGANAIERFVFITMPMLRAVGVVILFLAILGSLHIFDLVQVLTDGGPYFASDVVSTYIYHQAFGDISNAVTATQPNIGFASAASFFYGVILMVITSIQFIIVRSTRQKP
jgi:ABC-type sugar transport system permease subunit